MCDQRAENVRAEYAALIAYHNSIVTHRFTLLGFFVAALAIIVQGGMETYEACLILALTIAFYIVERRNRTLYTQMGKRAMEIEEKHWGLNRSSEEDKTLPLFCRFRQNELRDELTKQLTDELKKEIHANPKFWNKWEVPLLPASHSKGLDLLYAAVAIYAILGIFGGLISSEKKLPESAPPAAQRAL